MFVGFGYLMTFLQWYGLGAVGYTMLITSVCVLCSILLDSFFAQLYAGKGFHAISLSMTSLIDGNFAAAALLITFGALIGKAGPLQLLLLALLEVIVYNANLHLLLKGAFGIADIGGTIIIHNLGAYFGLGAAWVFGVPGMNGTPSPRSKSSGLENASTSTVSDLLSLVGTVFLWLYWPSFVAGEAPPDQMLTARINTVLSLLSSTITTFAVSSLLEKVIRPVDIQNATLAGGVAIGAAANLGVKPFGAMAVGTAAGLLSCWGFCRLQPWLEDRGLHDSCGVNNQHGMPSILGAVASAITFAASSQTYDLATAPRGADQAGYQIICVVVTTGIGLVAGALSAVIVQAVAPTPQAAFVDDASFEVADDFKKE